MIVYTPDDISWRGRRVTVMGLGFFGGGAGAARWLARQGAIVTVTDLKKEEELRESVEALHGCDVTLHLGGHREEDFACAEVVVVSPAVSPDSPWLKMAEGAVFETELNLFLKKCPASRVVAVTGSNGKTTTTMLIGAALARGFRRVWVGGNVGKSLLDDLESIGKEDIVALEVSSFQLENLRAIVRRPQVAVVTNLTPNHLDRHGTMEAYVAAKREIVKGQGARDWKVLNADDPVVTAFESPSRTLKFSSRGPVERGAWIEGERIHFKVTGTRFDLDVSRRRIPGAFNLENMAAAACAVFAVTGGAWADWAEETERAFNEFPGVEHRLEFVAEIGGVRYVNDSIATNPESTIRALETVPGPIVLIAGGYDKKLPFDGLVAAMAGRVRVAVLVGQTAEALAAMIRGVEVVRAGSFDEAIDAARAAARPGEAVLLSPACASYDLFRNFTDRGRRFKERVSSFR